MVIASFESSHFVHNLMPRFNFLLNMHGLAEKALRFNVSSLLYIKTNNNNNMEKTVYNLTNKQNWN